MAWESDAAKMTLVSNDQKPHFMTWDGVAVVIRLMSIARRASQKNHVVLALRFLRLPTSTICLSTVLFPIRAFYRVGPFEILLINHLPFYHLHGNVVGCPKVAADGTVISGTVLLTGRDHGFSFPEHLELPDYRMLHVIF
ncbi:hypothetical protein PCH_Pc24g00870 [Penicillium rubens Wisconsin 54-1255]|uniref:Uncharacterized protein n=1 Tax=Penicillium rubens (strain ATCC 28089 / DSM 1075 / NRRL 1951 / Wisconsin 54-1255) TaxID=500485 RepID=B6HWP5_PENRW|nr:hypothetical protein PCH_Pc24g00870 [Penicillium rubens Wisconsin 54-1255]